MTDERPLSSDEMIRQAREAFDAPIEYAGSGEVDIEGLDDDVQIRSQAPSRAPSTARPRRRRATRKPPKGFEPTPANPRVAAIVAVGLLVLGIAVALLLAYSSTGS